MFCHRRSLSAAASGREILLLLVTLGSLITQPSDPFALWIRDLRRHDRAWAEADYHTHRLGSVIINYHNIFIIAYNYVNI